MKYVVLLLFAVTMVVMAEDFEYNTGGSMGTVPTAAGSHDGWGEWFITCVHNSTGSDILLTEFGFPCCGPATGTYGWVVWTDVGDTFAAPIGDATTCDYYGSFTPVDPGPTSPPITYTYIDVSSEDIVIINGDFFCFGYDNTDLGGQINYNGVETWAWYEGAWDSDIPWGRTAVLEVSANFFTALERSTWGSIKTIF